MDTKHKQNFKSNKSFLISVFLESSPLQSVGEIGKKEGNADPHSTNLDDLTSQTALREADQPTELSAHSADI